MNTTEFRNKRKFIVKLGKMLHKYGTPAFRLEAYLVEIASQLGLHASFVSTPTSLTFVIWSDYHEDEYTLVARLLPGDLDLNSLAKTDKLARQVANNTVSLEQANTALDKIDAIGSPYGKTLTALGYSFSTAAFACLMGAGIGEIGVSAVLGIMVYLWTLWSTKSKRVSLMFEPVTAFTVAFVASLFAYYQFQGLNLWLVILSSLIILVPGLALTIGLAELSSRNVVSGTVRVMDAVMQLFKLYFGAFLGVYLSVALFGEFVVEAPQALPVFLQWVAVVMLSLGLVTIFKTQLMDIPLAISATVLAYAATTWSSSFLEQGIGAFFGAFFLGVYANVVARLMDKPALLVAMHGLIVLVPGSKTYIGLNSLISGQDFVQTDHIGQETFLILMSLVAGLIFANVVVPSRKAL